LQRIEREMIVAEVQNFFFLLRRGFSYAFSAVINGNEKNGYKATLILPKHADLISRRLVSFVFERIVPPPNPDQGDHRLSAQELRTVLGLSAGAGALLLVVPRTAAGVRGDGGGREDRPPDADILGVDL
jgi:hypothetical protein